MKAPGSWIVSAGALAGVVLLRWLLDPVLGDTLPLVTLFGAVATAVWVGGWVPAAAVAILGYVLCAYLFMAPRGSLGPPELHDVVGVLAYLTTCAIMIAFGEVARISRSRDVATHRRAEQEKADQLLTARLLSSIVESSDDAIISKSLDGTIQSWNAAAEHLFGYTAEQAVGRHISLIIPEDRLAEEDRILASLTAGQRIDHFETVRRRSDGRPISVSLTISPIRDESGRVAGASTIARDITRQRAAEEEREKFITLVESSTDFIAMCDLQGIPLFVNSAGLQMVGLDDLEQARRTPVPEFFFPEDRARIMDEFLPRVLATGHAEIEVRFRNFKTGNALWMAYKVLRLNDSSGKPVGFATVSQDVTERKGFEDDLRRLAADLADADRRKDEFLATLAHELRNPLAPLCNMLEVLKRAGEDRELLGRARDTIERQLGQMVRLVDDLLDLNRVTHNRFELRRSAVDLSAVIEQAVEASRPLADAAGHRLVVSLPREPLDLDADPARLAPVLGNLLNNGSK
jgi:PAS domain S-box-containing protein